MSMFRRRLLIQQALKTKHKGTLAYWLSGEDSPIDGAWVDRIDNRFKWKLQSADMHSEEEKCYIVGDNRYATFTDIGKYLDFGTRFEMVIDIYIDVPLGYSIDYGSVQSTDKNFGIGISSNPAYKNMLLTNYKMFGNSSNSKYGVSPVVQPEEQRQKLKIEQGRHIIIWGVEKYNETQNIVYVKIDNGEKIYAINPHVPIRHTNLNSNIYKIGGGIIAEAMQGNNKIYDIKVYVESYD